MIRIIAGHYRSRRLQTPEGIEGTRPYAQRVKESVFNVLRGHIEDANVLDLFAGVGTMGLEAISRGARQVLMVEQDRRVFKMLKANVDMLGCADQADLLCGDALGPVSVLRAPRPVRVVFIDPPFPMMKQDNTRARVLSQMTRLAPILAEDAIVVLRSPLDPTEVDLTVEDLAGPEVRPYRRAHEVLLYGPLSADEASASSSQPEEDQGGGDHGV
ncbi:MAG: 16S rRNA (guanine(966)-N(2))-methyltransferase RsmD [Phycisphaerales bacterium]|nr:16S rRNA (guanine(966)-N(2))-methyltransferase RsmD [Phycisphaerales bacterium]